MQHQSHIIRLRHGLVSSHNGSVTTFARAEFYIRDLDVLSCHARRREIAVRQYEQARLEVVEEESEFLCGVRRVQRSCSRTKRSRREDRCNDLWATGKSDTDSISALDTSRR